jgi:hypothetical protein
MATKQTKWFTVCTQARAEFTTYLPFKEKPTHIFAGKGQKRKKANELSGVLVPKKF